MPESKGVRLPLPGIFLVIRIIRPIYTNNLTNLFEQPSKTGIIVSLETEYRYFSSKVPITFALKYRYFQNPRPLSPYLFIDKIFFFVYEGGILFLFQLWGNMAQSSFASEKKD